jgi:hypothetical protein
VSIPAVPGLFPHIILLSAVNALRMDARNGAFPPQHGVCDLSEMAGVAEFLGGYELLVVVSHGSRRSDVG